MGENARVEFRGFWVCDKVLVFPDSFVDAAGIYHVPEHDLT